MDNNDDKYIRDTFKKDDLISKNADDIFNKFIKGEFEVEENKTSQEQEAEITQTKDKVVDINEAKEKRKNNKKFKKAFSAVASVAVVFVAANVYASTQGYENIFFMIKDLINGNSISVESKEDILSDRDITISYQPIEISDDLKIQINNLTIKENVAELTLTIDENDSITTRPVSYEVYDITTGEKLLLANQQSITQTDSMIASAPGSIYTENITLKNFKNNTKILELDVYAENEDLLISFEINLDEKEIDVLNRKEVVFEKISEVELKDVLSKYVALNYYDNKEYMFETLNNATKDEAKDMVLVELAMKLIYEKISDMDSDFMLSNAGDINMVNTAMKEITGKTYSEPIYLSNNVYIYYDETKNAYLYEPGDGSIVPGLCLDISDISFKDGIYTVSCIYCLPAEADYSEGLIAKIEQYKTIFKLKINENPEYAKYQIVNYDELTSEKIKESEKFNNSVPDNSNTDIDIPESSNTISNTVKPNNNNSSTTNTININTNSNSNSPITNTDNFNSNKYTSFLEDVVRVNFFNDLNSVTQYHTKEEYENEMKILSAFEIAGGDFMTYDQQNMIFKELFNEDVTNIDVANIVVKNTGLGYEYISKQHQAFATILKSVEDKDSNGINTVTVVYTYSDKNASINSNCEKFEVTFKYKENTNYTYSKYQVVNLKEIISNTKRYSSEVVDNLASSLEWETVYSIGLETVKPSTWEVITFDDLYDGSDKEQHGEVSTCILGEAKGIDKNTNEIITSNVQINYFTPMYLGKMSQVDAEDYIEKLLDIKSAGSGSYIFETDMSWNLYKKVGHDNQIYCSYDQMSDGSIWVYVIDFDTDNWDNLKVVNIMNRIIGRTKGCSF